MNISLSKVLKLNTLLIAILIIVAVFLNFYLVPITKSLSKKTFDHFDVLVENDLSMDLPVRVIQNVLAQLDGETEADAENSLLEIYDRYASTVVNLSQSNIDEASTFAEDLNQLDRLSFGRHNDTVKQMTQLLERISDHSEIVRDTVSNDYLDEEAFEVSLMLLEENRQWIETLSKFNDRLDSAILDDYALILNSIFALMVLIFIVLAVGIYRYLIKAQVFVSKSFEQLEKHDYDFSKLPKLNPLFSEEKYLVSMVQKIIDEEKLTKEVRDIVSQHYMMDELMEALFHKLNEAIGIDRIGVAFVDYERGKLLAEVGIANYDTVFLMPGFEVPFEFSRLKTVIDHKTVFVTDDLEADLKEHPKSAAVNLIYEEGIRSNAVIPLAIGDAVFGMVFLSSKQKNHFSKEYLRIAEKVIKEISLILNRSYFTKVIFAKITHSFAELVDHKDNETGDHILRMVRYSVVLADALRRTPREDYCVDRRLVLDIERYASVHDIGKVGVPDEILKKPGKLTPEEWEVMKRHVNVGADIFSSIREGLRFFDDDLYRVAEEITRHHHERWDGSGYPDGLKGLEIPVSSRIVAIADVFDALTSRRSYKEPFGFDESVEILKDSAGSHLDPVLVQVFIDQLEKIKSIYDDSWTV